MDTPCITLVNEAPASPAPGGFGSPPTPDAKCIPGPRGQLAVALGPDSLASVQRHARPTHWLLSVESPDLVRSSHHLPGTILWLGARPAARLLGALADVPLGAWLHPDGVEIRIDDGPPILLPRPGSPDAEPNVDELARLLVREWRKIGLAARARESATLRQASGILEEVAA